MTVKYLYPALSPHEHTLIKEWVTKLYLEKDKLPWEEKFNRHSFHNPPVLQKFHTLLEQVMSEIFQTPLKKSYCYVGMYGPTGICERHTDRIQCQYTFDLCLSQDEPWEIFVEDSEKVHRFSPLENSAVVYRGTDHPHWRDPRKSGQYCHMIFFHFVPVDFEGDLR